jgi:hypothetical protein
MDGLRRRYRRLDEWARGLSRGPYALLTGVTTGLLVLALTATLGDPLVFDAVLMTVCMTVAFYWADPNSE